MDLLLVWLVMKGKPKYKIGDKVIISISGFFHTLNNGEHVGEVYIVDPYGTYDDPSDVSYDVMIHDYNNALVCAKRALKRYEEERHISIPKVPICDTQGSIILTK